MKEGRVSERGFRSMWAPVPPMPGAPGFSRGTAAERGARKGFESPALLLGPEPPVEEEGQRSLVKWRKMVQLVQLTGLRGHECAWTVLIRQEQW